MSDIHILSKEEEKKGKPSFLKDNRNIIEKVNDYILSTQKIKTKDRAYFYRLLATMVNSWLTLLKSVSILKEQEQNPVLKKILVKFEKEIKTWKNLSYCMSLYPWSFDSSEIWIIESWEKTWKLNSALLTLSSQVEKIASMNWKLKSALMYPAMIILVVFWVIIVMMTKVVPNLVEIFWDKESLPASTKTLISISDFFVNYTLVFIIWVFIALGLVSFWKNTSSWKYAFDNIMIRMPIFGPIIKKIILSRFARVLSTLLSSWVSIVESLRITSGALWNEVYAQRVLLLRDDVKQWIKIWEALDWDTLFPIMLIQMIKVWEQTAQLDNIILKVADFYDEEIDNIVSTINKLLEPIVIVFMAVVIWAIALWIMQPIMQIANRVWS